MSIIDNEMRRTGNLLIAISIFSGLFWAAIGIGLYHAIKWLIYL